MALWAGILNVPAVGDDEIDLATYNGLRYYMGPDNDLFHAREAVVRAAKDRERDNSSQYLVSTELQMQFWYREIGYFPLTAWVNETVCGQWDLDAVQWPVGTQGAVTQDFALRFESGSSLNEDGGVGSPTYGIDLGTYNSNTLPGYFTSSQVGGHTGSDGHWHSFRLRVQAQPGGDAGYLDYYAGRGPVCGSFVVTPTAPSFVTVKTTYQLTGSSSHAATGWLWEQSYDGGAYGFWSNQQNSSFLANNGYYTLGWRLSAARTYDNAVDTGWAQTQVCIPFNPSCYAVRVAGQTTSPADSIGARGRPTAVGDHFGSGLWIAAGRGAQRRLIRMYAFSGIHDSSSRPVPWPNILERDGGDWSYSTPAGPLTLATRRQSAGDHRSLLLVSGRLTGGQNLSIGLAADPDLGEATDDVLGFDAEIGIAWARDGASDRYIGYLPLGSGTVRVRQFGAGLDEAPESRSEALRLMTAPTRLASGQAGDVRFLLTGPDVTALSDGRFEAVFAILRATSEEDLLTLARDTRREAPALLAGLLNDPDQFTETFTLRQSVSTSLLASVSGAEGTSAAVAQLQAVGITALDYTIPTGKDVSVRIRLYNNRGQLVRTLVDQRSSGGNYRVEWDRLNERGERVPVGVYVAVMEAGEFRATRKLVVTR